MHARACVSTCSASTDRNRAIEASHGNYLCLLDSDDVMLPARVQAQLQCSIAHPTAIVGCDFCRIPDGSTPYYTNWVRSLSGDSLYLQRHVHTLRSPKHSACIVQVSRVHSNLPYMVHAS
jgi:glycosyltransferase involved in cell wall biosynthesis